jgi:hypothetical protein
LEDIMSVLRIARQGQWLRILLTLTALGTTLASCSDDSSTTGGTRTGSGGSSDRDASSTGGSGGSGATGTAGKAGSTGTGGTTGSGGATGTGGTTGTGGSTTGGASGTGGTGGKGGTTGTGGSTGGGAGSGGSTGGTAGKGATAGTGGATSKDAAAPDVVNPPTDGGGSGMGGKLGKKNFMIGLGPNESAYPATGQLDIRYAYLVGNADVNSSWTKWNSPDGEFAAVVARGADQHGAIPMFDMYEFAADGDGNFSIVNDATFMARYWADVQLLADKIKAFDKPAIVHIEPDFWGYAQSNATNGDPTKFPTQVKISPTCSDLPDDLTGLARCAIRIFHTTSPKAVVGLHASQWAAYDAKGNPDGAAVGKFLAQASGGQADYVSTDILDRDAGCFEAQPSAYDCTRGGTTGWYWDESNATSPNFKDYLAWAKAMHDGAGAPILWWQTPMGAPSATPGGAANAYRDNRVHYIFSHVREFIDAGGVGACFGAGAKGQTTVSTDGGQFEQALVKYNGAPEAL